MSVPSLPCFESFAFSRPDRGEIVADFAQVFDEKPPRQDDRPTIGADRAAVCADGDAIGMFSTFRAGDRLMIGADGRGICADGAAVGTFFRPIFVDLGSNRVRNLKFGPQTADQHSGAPPTVSTGPFTDRYWSELRAEPEMVAALTAVIPIIAAHQAELKLSNADLAELQAMSDRFIQSSQAATTAALQLKAALATKDRDKQAAMACIRKWAKVWRADLSIPDPLLERVMASKHRVPGTRRGLLPPANLQAKADGQGYVGLTWETGGNPRGTLYVIESFDASAQVWRTIGVATSRRFAWSTTPGEQIAFRIRAQRRGRWSEASNEVVLWNGLGPSFRAAA